MAFHREDLSALPGASPTPKYSSLVRVRRAAVAAFAVVWAGSCVPHPVGPARTYGKYVSKARTTARSALSVVETVRLAADAGARGRAFGPYLSVLVSEQEEAVSKVQGTFDSIQPPDDRADHLRDDLDRLLGDALDHVSEVRLAVRRGELPDLNHVAAPLREDSARLNRFIEAHG